MGGEAPWLPLGKRVLVVLQGLDFWPHFIVRCAQSSESKANTITYTAYPCVNRTSFEQRRQKTQLPEDPEELINLRVPVEKRLLGCQFCKYGPYTPDVNRRGVAS